MQAKKIKPSKKMIFFSLIIISVSSIFYLLTINYNQICATFTQPNHDNSQITYIQDILLVNKTYSLPETYNPGEEQQALEAFHKMKIDSSYQKLNLYISSSFRSFEKQKQLYEKYVAKDGQAKADTYSARPGHSEHQTGLAFDLNGVRNDFKNSAEYKWLKENCYKYGFIIRYPENKQDITGYRFEPWHIRYIGPDMAKKVYDSGLCLEEYLGVTSVYQ